MVEPDTERIVGYPEIAMSVMTYSNTGDVTAELVDVGRGTRDADYAGKNVRGKFVLATGYGGDVHRLAVLKYGARAVACYLDDDRAQEWPDMLQYTGMWPKTKELGRVTFGFNLTNRQGRKLRELLVAGKRVVLHGWVKGIGLEPYFMDVVVAHIRGTEKADEELVFSAHLDHPKESANDNASGSAALLDIARTTRELIAGGRLPKPRRSFRFVWVPEWNGTMAYVDAHPELKGPALDGHVLANLNMDMVGEHPEILHSFLILTRTPASIPSCVNDVIENMAAMVDNIDVRTPRGSLSAFNYRVTPYSGGSDHMMFIDRKIPGIMFSHADWTHHTSEDTPDKVDPVELERCEILSLGAAWYLANLDARQAVATVLLVSAKSSERFGEAVRRAAGSVADATGAGLPLAWAEAQNSIDGALARENAAIASVLTFNDDPQVKELADRGQETLLKQHLSATQWLRSAAARRGVQLSVPPPVSAAVDDRVPVRLTRGPLDFSLPESALDSARAAWYGSAGLDGDIRFELVNFIDGTRSIMEIRNALSAEFRPVELPTVSRYCEDLVRAGVVKWK
jgi:hypothetical protein